MPIVNPYKSLLYFTAIILLFSCKMDKNNNSAVKVAKTEDMSFDQKPSNISTPEGMVWVEGKVFMQGAKNNDPFAMPREKPARQVAVDGFFIDITEVTNKEFRAFVEATGYQTIAERPIDWETMKKDLPAGTPKPPDSILQPGSLVFNKKVKKQVNMQNYNEWWTWKIGANWQHPEGPESNIDNKDIYPVVHIAYEDALAYCKWANRRLPTEAEWESAAQGSNTDNIYTWGNNFNVLNDNANTWQGVFPVKNDGLDGFTDVAPVKSFPPNQIGIYDMMGNVWELTSDWFNIEYYNNVNDNPIVRNPKGAEEYYNPQNPYQKEKIIKGGSYLCHESYCASFRISARMGTTLDSGSDHTGFRTVATVEMLNPK